MGMAAAKSGSGKAASAKRTASKETRQLQLIKATIRSIAKNGLSTTTMATVSKEAGLSQGIINLHFNSKDRLLVETLKHVADEYRSAWERALDNSGDSAAAKMKALVAVDFEKRLCDRNVLAVWFAFWGETKSRPTYRKICRERDKDYGEVLTALCAELIEEGNYQDIRAESVALGLAAMGEGLWLDLLMSPDVMTAELAFEICMDYLKSMFPRHF